MGDYLLVADVVISNQSIKDNQGLIAVIAVVCLLIGFKDRIRR